MKKILIFGGTTEGRIISKIFSKNDFLCHVSVATDYGKQLLSESANLKILNGRLDEKEMDSLCEKNKYDLIIDATHPFAEVVSENVKSCAGKKSIPLIRFERNVNFDEENCISVSSPEECEKHLSETSGKILLTTGSKDLSVYCRNESIRKRLVVRVLPCIESIKACYENGLEGNQIIAMQGPFTEKMNEVQIEDSDIQVLVTKDSGHTGGTDTKIAAALNKKIKCIVIKKAFSETKESDEKYFKAASIKEVITKAEEILQEKISFQPKIRLSLCGAGMGRENLLTVEVQEKIKNADLIFGAKRLLENISSSARKFPFYLAKDILPKLKEISEETQADLNAVVLFSGDTGFYSGAAKFCEEVKSFPEIECEVLPGISSLSYFASKLKVPYEDSEIISLHGTNPDAWKPELKKALSLKKKIFLLTSGSEDVKTVFRIVSDLNGKTFYKIISGFQLSYDDEKIEIIDEKKFDEMKSKGLYSLFIFPENRSIM